MRKRTYVSGVSWLFLAVALLGVFAQSCNGYTDDDVEERGELYPPQPLPLPPMTPRPPHTRGDLPLGDGCTFFYQHGGYQRMCGGMFRGLHGGTELIL